MLRETAQLLEHVQPLWPELALLEGVGEEPEESVGLRALLGLAKCLPHVDEGVGVARVLVDLIEPEGLEIVELLLLYQSIRIVAERH